MEFLPHVVNKRAKHVLVFFLGTNKVIFKCFIKIKACEAAPNRKKKQSPEDASNVWDLRFQFARLKLVFRRTAA